MLSSIKENEVYVVGNQAIYAVIFRLPLGQLIKGSYDLCKFVYPFFYYVFKALHNSL